MDNLFNTLLYWLFSSTVGTVFRFIMVGLLITIALYLSTRIELPLR